MLALFTQAYRTHGGMQTYMRRIAEIASAYCARKQEPLDCLSLTDVESVPALHQHPVVFRRMIAARGSKTRFVTETLRASRSAVGLAIVGHLALAPAALALRRIGAISGYVIVLHGIEAWRRCSPVVRLAANNATAIVATTKFTAAEFQARNGLALRRVFVIPLAVGDSSVAEPVSARGGGQLRVLSVGRMDRSESYKGFDELIRALVRLRMEGADVQLEMVGGGDDRPRLERLSESLGVREHVAFPGSIPEEDLRQRYTQSDLFALPSKCEGFGLAFLEAMRHARPCIGGNHGGTPEVIRHGEDGFLVDHGDVDQLADRLRCWYGDRACLDRMGRRAFARVREEYLFPRMSRRWFEMFQELEGKGREDVRHSR